MPLSSRRHAHPCCDHRQRVRAGSPSPSPRRSSRRRCDCLRGTAACRLRGGASGSRTGRQSRRSPTWRAPPGDFLYSCVVEEAAAEEGERRELKRQRRETKRKQRVANAATALPCMRGRSTVPPTRESST
jgi:hypothetical protein